MTATQNSPTPPRFMSQRRGCDDDLELDPGCLVDRRRNDSPDLRTKLIIQLSLQRVDAEGDGGLVRGHRGRPRGRTPHSPMKYGRRLEESSRPADAPGNRIPPKADPRHFASL